MFIFSFIVFLGPPLHHPCQCFRLVPFNTIKSTDKSNICSSMMTTAAMQPKLHGGLKATRKQTRKAAWQKGKIPATTTIQLSNVISSSSIPLQATIIITSSHTTTRCKTPEFTAYAGPLGTSFDPPHIQHHPRRLQLPFLIKFVNCSKNWQTKVGAKSEENITRIQASVSSPPRPISHTSEAERVHGETCRQTDALGKLLGGDRNR